ncbi:MAG: 8-amino-7-oxononanoate synthase [Candidatus Omnitrophica bacterium]|nr:8-amino-7-oxononanoate synthase [Candidatus Omnitrophota bacterium]
MLPRELQEELTQLRHKNLYRRLQTVSKISGPVIFFGKKRLVNFSSNNYLGLVHHPEIISKAASALKKWGTGSGASRLVSGDLAIHAELEKRLAEFKREETALVFSSGYLANLGAVTALAGEEDVVMVDRLNHASLIDAARLSRAKFWVYPHKDVSSVSKLLDRAKSYRRRLVLTDAYFSMDGDAAPLAGLAEVCAEKKAILYIDEAHSTGVFGKSGRGMTEHFNLSGQIDVVMGTLSKAFGSVGGFVAGKNILRETMVNRSREFIYTTAPAPASSAAALAALDVIENKPEIRKKLWENIRFVREALLGMGFDLMDSEGPIIPVRIGESAKVLRLKEFFSEEGIFVSAIRPPTVPRGTDRIRVSIMATHTKDHLNEMLSAFKKVRKQIL